MDSLGNRESNVVLVVEDDNEFRELLEIVLRSEGMTVLSVTDGGKAMSTAHTELPDLILMDIMLPSINGVEVTKKLKSNPDTQHIPIIMVTSKNKKAAIVDGLNAGAIDYITKPFFVPELIARTNAVLQYKRLHDDLKDAKEQLIQSEEKYRLLVENASDAILVIQNNKILFTNASVSKLLACSQDELTLELLMELVLQDDRSMVLEHQKRAFVGEAHPHVCAFRIIDRDGGIKWMEMKSSLITWGGEAATLNFLSDITERKQKEEEIHQLAYYDDLTGLPNRLTFHEHIKRALNYPEQRGGTSAILFLDVDRFKDVNDMFGHAVGDLLLKAVAGRLRQTLRKTENASPRAAQSSNCLARFGGDEFIILLTDITRPQDAVAVAQRLMHTLSHPFVLDEHKIRITVSIGISLYPMDGDDIDALVKKADVAMYHIKEGGGNNYCFHSDSINAVS